MLHVKRPCDGGYNPCDGLGMFLYPGWICNERIRVIKELSDGGCEERHWMLGVNRVKAGVIACGEAGGLSDWVAVRDTVWEIL